MIERCKKKFVLSDGLDPCSGCKPVCRLHESTRMTIDDERGVGNQIITVSTDQLVSRMARNPMDVCPTAIDIDKCVSDKVTRSSWSQKPGKRIQWEWERERDCECRFSRNAESCSACQPCVAVTRGKERCTAGGPQAILGAQSICSNREKFACRLSLHDDGRSGIPKYIEILKT